jgi:hypothetical protein
MPFEYEEPGEDYEFFEEDGESFVTSYVGPRDCYRHAS